MIRIVLALGILLAGASASRAQGNCTVQDIRLIPDVTVTGYMYVKAGKSCGIIVGNSFGPAGVPQIMQRASHGTVGVSGLRISYAPRKGFVGKDSFGYFRNSLDGQNRPIKLSVIVQVTVQP